MANRTLPSPQQPTGLLVHLLAMLSDTKRTRVKEILRSGLVHVNGASITQHDTQICGDDTVEIRDERAAAKRSFPFDVLFEDATILVINKPNGLLIVGNKHEKTRTVESIVNRALAAQRQRCYIVQRLDLYTSGVLLLAKTELAQTRIKDNWGDSDKIYHAARRRRSRSAASDPHTLSQGGRSTSRPRPRKTRPQRDQSDSVLRNAKTPKRSHAHPHPTQDRQEKPNTLRKCQQSAILLPATPNTEPPRTHSDVCACTHPAYPFNIRKPTNGYPSKPPFHQAWISNDPRAATWVG